MRVSFFPSQKPLPALLITWILLLPLLFFMVRGTPSYDHLADVTGTTQYGYGNAFTKMELAITYTLALAAIFPYWQSMLQLMTRNKLVLLLPAFAVFSAAWSQEPSRSLIFGGSVLVMTLFALFLVERWSPGRQIELIVFVGSIIMLLSYFLVALFPTIGITTAYTGRPWNGIFAHKNHLGTIMTYLVLTAFYWVPTTRPSRWAKSGFIYGALLLILMSKSRTAWLLLASALAVVVILRYLPRFRSIERLAIVLCLAGLSVIFALLVVQYLPQLTRLMGKDPTLNGRTEIWAGLIPSVMKRPFLGYGYDSFFLGAKGESGIWMYATDNLGLQNSENAVLQVWLDLGLIGVAILFWTFFESCKNAIFCLRFKPSSRYVHWCALMVFLNLVALVDGDKIMAPNTIEWVLYVMAFVGLSSEARRIRLQRFR